MCEAQVQIYLILSSCNTPSVNHIAIGLFLLCLFSRVGHFVLRIHQVFILCISVVMVVVVVCFPFSSCFASALVVLTLSVSLSGLFFVGLDLQIGMMTDNARMCARVSS